MICRFLAVVNSSCNFCLYCFMSRDFRTELFKMVQKCRFRQTPVTATDRTSTVYPSPTSHRGVSSCQGSPVTAARTTATVRDSRMGMERKYLETSL